jgi:hypothetical protein
MVYSGASQPGFERAQTRLIEQRSTLNAKRELIRARAVTDANENHDLFFVCFQPKCIKFFHT